MRLLLISPPPKEKAAVVHFFVDQRFRRLITFLSWLLAACLHVILPSQRTKSAQFQRTEFSKFPGGRIPQEHPKKQRFRRWFGPFSPLDRTLPRKKNLLTDLFY